MDILIIEDEGLIRHMLIEILEEEGYEVAGAANGAIALSQLRTTRRLPRLILLDLNMPVMNGWEFRSIQDQDPLLADIPIIILSAGRGIDREATALDAVGYLTKPIDLSALLALIKTYYPLTEA